MRATRKKAGKMAGLGYKFDAQLVAALRDLATSNGTSLYEALRRSMIRTVMEQRIPGIEPLEIEPETYPASKEMDEIKRLEKENQELREDQDRYVAKSTSEMEADTARNPSQAGAESSRQKKKDISRAG